MIQEFLNYQEKRKGLSALTLEAYAKDLKKFAHWASGEGLRWTTITKQDIDRWLITLQENGLKATSINRHASSVRNLLTWAHHEGILKTNAGQYLQAMKTEERLPEQADTKAIEEYLQTEPTTERGRVIHALIQLLLETGIRIQEAIDIRMEDVDAPNRTIKIHGKGRRERIAYFTDKSIAQLVRIGGTYAPNLFPQWEQRTYRTMMIEELKPRGIRTHPHALRHTFATTMLNRGADITVVSFLLGHKSVKTTERYAKVSNETARQQYNQFN